MKLLCFVFVVCFAGALAQPPGEEPSSQTKGDPGTGTGASGDPPGTGDEGSVPETPPTTAEIERLGWQGGWATVQEVRETRQGMWKTTSKGRKPVSISTTLPDRYGQSSSSSSRRRPTCREVMVELNRQARQRGSAEERSRSRSPVPQYFRKDDDQCIKQRHWERDRIARGAAYMNPEAPSDCYDRWGVNVPYCPPGYFLRRSTLTNRWLVIEIKVEEVD